MQDYYKCSVYMNKKGIKRGEMDLQNSPTVSVLISALRESPLALTFLVIDVLPAEAQTGSWLLQLKSVRWFFLLLLAEVNTAKLEQEATFQSILCNPVHRYLQSS